MKKQKVQLKPGAYIMKDGKLMEDLNDPAMLIRKDNREVAEEEAKPKTEKKEKSK
jgi:hypothetical protein